MCRNTEFHAGALYVGRKKIGDRVADTLDDLLAYCQADGRVCPQPQRWNELWQLLPDIRRKDAGYEPSAPLILAAWWESSDEEKQDRLAVHVRWAQTHGALDAVSKFLRGLPEKEWHHATD